MNKLFEFEDAISQINVLILNEIATLPLDEKIEAINQLRALIHSISPFKNEPVDYVRWVKNDLVCANDYNPNSVAPPEMELLRVSIASDGYTQPIVSMLNESGNYEVIDGFHRHRVGKECKDIQCNIYGYLPIVKIRDNRTDRADRIASTIRHNRARGKHRVDAMSDIVVELKRRNWSNQRIATNLGMDEDEILRLCQITGLSELFSDQQFSKSWDIEGHVTEEDFKELSDDINTYGEETSSFRTVNTNDENRIFHTYDKWECYKAGFYSNTKDGISKADGEEEYRRFLSDHERFEKALQGVISEWKNSCEHYLTNISMNRIAWLGQAAMCYATGIPAAFRSGFFLLTETEQIAANELALIYLNKWLIANNLESVSMEQAYSGDRQSDIY